MRIKGVLFDFDGTLTFPGALDFPAIKERLGCPLDQPVLEFLEAQPETRRGELTKILEEIEEGAAEASRPNNGAERCLLSLRKKGFRLGILTRNRLSSVERALEKFNGISIGDFAAIITREFSPPKPHPGGVQRAAMQMGLLPEEILVVGDFRFDVIAGKAAGAKTVLLTNGGRSVMSPGDPEPDYTFSCLEELLDIL
jgi:hydrogenase expression/formation protein HypE